MYQFAFKMYTFITSQYQWLQNVFQIVLSFMFALFSVGKIVIDTVLSYGFKH